MTKNLPIVLVGLVAAVGLVLGIVGKDSAPVTKLGALSGPEIPYEFLSWGASSGVRLWSTGRGLTQASTTVCAIQSPAATSTLVRGGVSFTVSSTSALAAIDIAKGTALNASTTLIRTSSLAAGAQGTIIAASTTLDSLALTNSIFAPNQWFVVKVAGGVTAGDTAGTGFVPTGSCHATFEEYISL